MTKSNFFKAYWPVAGLAGATALPRAFITPEDVGEHVSSPIGQFVLEEVGFIITFLILFSGLLYWFFEYLGYRFNFLLKTLHLVFTYPLLLLAALSFYYYQYEKGLTTSDTATSSIGAMYGRPYWLEQLIEMKQTVLMMFLFAQATAVLHLIVVLVKGRDQTTPEVPEVLDRLG
jgi:hypothetical protein